MISWASGASRFVLLVGRWALKFPHPGGWRRFLFGLIHNMSEAAFSKMNDPRLCPVLWSIPGGFLVCMRRARPLREWTEREIIETNEIACELPGRPQVPAESKQSSWGWLDGRLVAVDYGTHR